MKENGRNMYIVPELMKAISEISEELGIGYAESQRVLAEEHKHVTIKDIHINGNRKVDVSTLVLVPKKELVRGVI